MVKGKQNWLISIGVGIMALALVAACSSGGGGGSSSGGGGGTNPYLGTASLTGSVAVSQSDVAKVLSNDPTSSLRSASVKTLSKAQIKAKLAKIRPCLIKALESDTTVLDEGTARLFEVKSDGTTKPTGVSTSVTDGEYTFEDIKDGVNYMVEVYKIGFDSSGKKNIVRQTAYAPVPEGATTVTQDVTPKTGVILNFIISKIVEVTKDTNIEQSLLNTIIEAVANAITTLIESGAITIESRVDTFTTDMEASYTTAAASAEFAGVSEQDKALTELVSDDSSVSDAQKLTELKNNASKDLTDLEVAKKFIRNVMGMSLSQGASETSQGSSTKGDYIPDFFVEKFAQGYMNKLSWTILAFATQYNAAVQNPDMKSGTYSITNVKNAMINAISQGVVKQLYDAYDSGVSSNINAIAVEARAVFSESEKTKWANATQETVMTVPQALYIMKAANLMGGGEGGPPMNPIAFITNLRMYDDAETVMIVEKQIMPCMVGVEESGMWHEVTALQSHIVIYYNGTTYPSGSPVSRVDLVYHDKTTNEAKTQAYILNPYMQAPSRSFVAKIAEKARALVSKKIKAKSGPMGETSEEWMIQPWDMWVNNVKTAGTVVKNFKTGEVQIKVYGASNNLLTSATHNIIYLEAATIQWVYPKGPNAELLAKNGWDPDFEAESIPVDETTNTVKPKLQWQVPTCSVPSGYSLAYAVNLGMSARKLNWDQPMGTVPEPAAIFNSQAAGQWEGQDPNGKWKNVWDSWQTGRFIKTNIYQLPIALAATTENAAQNYVVQYEVNVTPILIDNNTQEQVWQGYSSRCEFKAGSSADSGWTVTLNGKVVFPADFSTRVWLPKNTTTNQIVAGTWKIGLFRMNGQDNGTWKEFFFAQNTTARHPISANGAEIIAELGNMAAVDNSSATEIAFTLPPIHKSDAALIRNNCYQLLVWYDITEKPSYTDWNNIETPANNAIDFGTNTWGNNTNYCPVEFQEMQQGNFRLENTYMMYQAFGSGGANQMLKNFSTSPEAITLRVADWAQPK